MSYHHNVIFPEPSSLPSFGVNVPRQMHVQYGPWSTGIANDVRERPWTRLQDSCCDSVRRLVGTFTDPCYLIISKAQVTTPLLNMNLPNLEPHCSIHNSIDYSTVYSQDLWLFMSPNQTHLFLQHSSWIKLGCRSLSTRRKDHQSFSKATHLPTKYRLAPLSPLCTAD